MNIRKLLAVSLLTSIHAITTTAQETASFTEIINRLPQPPASLQQAMDKSTASAESQLETAAKAIKMNTEKAYRPLYTFFLNNLASGQHSSAATSSEERMLYRNYSVGSKELSADNQYLHFQLVMESRPFLGSKLLSWGLPAKFSGAEKDIYLQVLSIEKMFDHALLKSTSQTVKLDFGNSDPVLNAINASFSKELTKIPKRNVKMPEGFTIEMEDPAKAMIVYKNYGRQRQDHFIQLYTTHFASWQFQYTRLSAIAEKLDALLQNAQPQTPVAAALLSDLQGSMWDATTHLVTATNRLWQDILIAQLGQKQVNEAIDMYTTYNSNVQ